MPSLKRYSLSSKENHAGQIVYTDSLSSCDKLDVSGFIHYRINHSKEFADRQNHINGIENFWNQAKRVLRK
ncbi:putative transposase, partial [Neisseria meningitidis NM313]